ncbi:unnamed protein product [Medioppia subpectinata]|uniref:Protein kinase domain-containing protein n=1 Tax=Medioppia subpectinata TaxID=1979941 RepID=A0A7R9KN59_9ACAR|nr:unnamed protein product [Medioppia subpectinata]CAG2106347.1 unnamed protein product [Medioppia subpectinata]
MAGIKSIHASYGSSFAITCDGLVFSWGDNRGHELGHNIDDERVFKPRLIVTLNGVKELCYNLYEKTKYYTFKEAEMLAKLDSNCIVKYYDSWIEGSQQYIQMEYCTQSLRTLIEDKLRVFGRQSVDNYWSNKSNTKPMDIIEYFISCEIFRELLQCVQYLHELDPPIIHRDIKPDNFLISNNYNNRFIKLCDFHMATEHNSEYQTHTLGVGTQRYMAPEIGCGQYNIKVDIYSLGILGMELFQIDNINSKEIYIETTFFGYVDNLYNIISSMIHLICDNRPTSAQILQLNNQWSINKSIIISDKTFTELLNKLQLCDNSFFYDFVLSKLRDDNQSTDSINKSHNSIVKKQMLSKLDFDFKNKQRFTENLSYKSSDGYYKTQFIEMSTIRLGSFGTVFKVKYKLDDKIYAVKRVQLEDLTENTKYRKEVNMLVKFGSNFIVKYYNSWTQGSQFYIQIEYCTQSLWTVMTTKPRIFGRQSVNKYWNNKSDTNPMDIIEYFISCEIFRELIECVEYLHGLQPPIIHRNITPDTFLISHNYNNRFIKLCDFHLATEHNMECQNNTPWVGTPKYIAPEVFYGLYNTKLDIYSLDDNQSTDSTNKGHNSITENQMLTKLTIDFKNEETVTKNLNDESIDGYYEAQFIDISIIGLGGFGTVFKVKHRLDDKIYAVKRVQFGGYSEEKKYKIVNEVKSLTTLNSKFVVKYYNSWFEFNQLYIQMEFCSQNLKTLLKDKPIVFGRQPEDPINSFFEYFISCEIFKEMLECVQYLHESKPPIIHRNLKLVNILIERNVRCNRFVKLSDFGLDTYYDMDDIKQLTGVGRNIYMAPELFSGGQYNHKADIYALSQVGQQLFSFKS